MPEKKTPPGLPLRIYVSGGDKDINRYTVWAVLDDIATEFGLWYRPEPDGNTLPRDIVIMAGEHPGATMHALDWAATNWLVGEIYKPKWGTEGYRATILRDLRVLRLLNKPHIVLLFPDKRPAAKLLKQRATYAGMDVREIVLAPIVREAAYTGEQESS